MSSILKVRKPNGEIVDVLALKGEKGEQGLQGQQGPAGNDGYTPVKGIDYYTESDKAEFEEYIATELSKRGQLKPEFANSVAECTDTTKLYVLPDGYIYAFMRTTVTTEGELKPAFTNLKDVCVFKYQQRYSMSGGGYKTQQSYTGIVIPVPSGATTSVIRFKNIEKNTEYTAIYGGTSTDSFTETITVSEAENGLWGEPDEEGVLTFTCKKASNTTYIYLTLVGSSASDFTDMIVTVDESIEYTKTTETVETEGFANTGHAFVPADYEDRILNLEDKADSITENTSRISALERNMENSYSSIGIHSAVGSIYSPSQKPAAADYEGYDIDILGATADDMYAYIDNVVGSNNSVTKEILGKDTSENYDIARYIYANREYCAWQKQNYPKMYAWKNGSVVIYSESISPRIGDTLYSTVYIGLVYGTVTEVNATNRSRIVNGIEFVRYDSGDIEPSVIYTDVDDDRNSNTTIIKDGVTYTRYPLGDLGANKEKLIPIFIYANEHGVELAGLDETSERYQKFETKMCALIAARLVRDMASGKQGSNSFYKFIRENCMLIVIPVANPFGFNMNVTGITNSYNDGYYNYNNCNINRNYDTPGWDVMNPNGTIVTFGSYVGSENETQYVMNTMVESGAVVAMSLHGLGGWEGFCAHQGQNPDGTDYNQEKLQKVVAFLKNNYGYTLRYYDDVPCANMPDVTSKSPSYITQSGAYGGIVEFSPDDVNVSGWKQEMKDSVIENTYAQMLNLMAMWLSDYLEKSES